jgi:WhiB family redox-sensing transcriptional regulator
MTQSTVISLNLPGMRKPMTEEQLPVISRVSPAAPLLPLAAEAPVAPVAPLGVVGGGDVLDLTTWQERALCSQTDPEAFFPEKGGSTREAKKVCLGCEVRVECLEYALANDERFGIWGGLSERERRRVKREAI